MDNALVDGSLLSSGELFGGQPLSIQLQLEPKFSVVTEGSASFQIKVMVILFYTEY